MTHRNDSTGSSVREQAPGLLLSLTLCLLALGSSPAAAQWSVAGHAFVRGSQSEGPVSWRDGGFGRLDLGGEAEGDGDDDRNQGLARLHLVTEGDLWRADGAGSSIGAYLHAVARAEPEEIDGDPFGVVEAFARFEPRLSSPARRLVWRVGHFILPTSRENVDLGWSSPYTMSFSALNSWIGEEVRLTGVDLTLHQPVGDLDEMRFTVAAFGGNDTAGTLLAWRGWAMGDRLTGFGETLPLPPLRGLAPGGAFELQQAEGTTPFGSDLDGRVGWAAAWRYQRAEQGTFQLTVYDNRGDRGLHHGEYAWQTSFYLAGGDWTFELPASRLTAAAEWMWGETGMGDPALKHVQVDFAALYGLLSWEGETWRATLRWDRFETEDLDGSAGYDPNDGDGDAWTAALFHQAPESSWRFGLELVDLDATRTAAGRFGTSADTSGRSLSLEVRWLF